MQSPLNARPVVGAERADVVGDVLNVGEVDLPVAEDYGVIGEAGLRRPSEIEDDFEKLVAVFSIYQSFRDPWREFFNNFLQVGLNPLLHLVFSYTSGSIEFRTCSHASSKHRTMKT